MQEKCGSKSEKLYSAFVHLEKAFDRVPREVSRRALRKAGVEEWLVNAVMAKYESTTGDSKAFLCEGRATSRVCFKSFTICDSNGHNYHRAQAGLPLELLYADDFTLHYITLISI